MPITHIGFWRFSEQNEILRYEADLAVRWIFQRRILCTILLLCCLEPYGGVVQLVLALQATGLLDKLRLGYLPSSVCSELIFQILNPFTCILYLLGMHTLTARLSFYFSGRMVEQLRLSRIQWHELWPALLIRAAMFEVTFIFCMGFRQMLDTVLHYSVGINLAPGQVWLIRHTFPYLANMEFSPPPNIPFAIAMNLIECMSLLLLTPGMICLVAIASLPKGTYWKQGIMLLSFYTIWFAVRAKIYDLIPSGDNWWQERIAEESMSLGIAAFIGLLNWKIGLLLLQSRKSEQRILGNLEHFPYQLAGGT